MKPFGALIFTLTMVLSQGFATGQIFTTTLFTTNRGFRTVRYAGLHCFVALFLSLATAQVTPIKETERYTPVVQSVPTPPRWFQGTDDRIHLVYELLLTNGFPVPVTVTSVEVLDAGSDRALATLTGDDLSAAMSLMASGTTPTTTVPPSSIAVVWFDVLLQDPTQLPEAVKHQVIVKVPPGLPVSSNITSFGGVATVDRRAPVVLSPPLEGLGWLALGSCCNGPHRRALQPIGGGLHLSQRFAIDFNRLDANSRIVVGDESVNENYPTYDQPVFAVADARVVEAVDRFADQIPNSPRPVTLEEADGNYIVLDLGGGRFAFYAHLKPSSVLVETGQRVRKGEVLARTGNTGSSSGPHLHFHVMDRSSPLKSDGLPYVFDKFELEGHAPPIEILMQGDVTASVPVDTMEAGPEHDVLPLGADVVTFPEQK